MSFLKTCQHLCSLVGFCFYNLIAICLLSPGLSVPTLNPSLGGVMPAGALPSNPLVGAGLMGTPGIGPAASLAGISGLGGGLAGGLLQPSPCFMLQNMFDPAK